jgi:hypothetical protein
MMALSDEMFISADASSTLQYASWIVKYIALNDKTFKTKLNKKLSDPIQ